MLSSRRTFLQTSLAAGGTLALGAAAAPAMARLMRPTHAPKSLLILGGTGFIGPHITEAAKARGMTVTHFNRGRSETRLLKPVDGVEKLHGDRDPNVGDGLKALEGRKFDAVVDTSGYVPRIVKASAELLAPNVGQYVFISTISVYADHATPGADESAPLARMEDPTNEEVRRYYGELKALCEEAAEAAMPGRVANVRPGYIVGPGDPTDRFTYWPVRFDRGGEVLVPGTPNDPVQFIDARDLAAWVVHLIATGTNGAFNATGPVGGCKVGELVEACRKAGSKAAEPVYADVEFLREKLAPTEHLPILIPPHGEYMGFHERSIAKAVGAALKTRPILETVRDTLAWWPQERERRVKATQEMFEKADKENQPRPPLGDPLKLRAGLEAEREGAILTALRERNK